MKLYKFNFPYTKDSIFENKTITSASIVYVAPMHYFLPNLNIVPFIDYCDIFINIKIQRYQEFHLMKLYRYFQHRDIISFPGYFGKKHISFCRKIPGQLPQHMYIEWASHYTTIKYNLIELLPTYENSVLYNIRRNPGII